MMSLILATFASLSVASIGTLVKPNSHDSIYATQCTRIYTIIQPSPDKFLTIYRLLS